MIDRKVEEDERRKARQHEDVLTAVRNDVQREVQEETRREAPQERAEVTRAAHEIKHKVIEEVSTDQAELERARRVTRTSQFIDYAFYVLYGLIGLEIALELLGAREAAGFKQLLDTATAPFLAPFRGLMPDPAVGSFQLMLSYVIALIVYILIHMAINGALRLFASRKTAF